MPSQFVRRMYLDAGLGEDRVHVVPNGVDLERFAPEGETYPLDGTPAVRFLFVGGAIARKGVDMLLAAWQEAFADRDDVQLVIKDFGSDGVYRGADRSAIHAAAEAGSVVHLDADLADAEMAALYRACDVLVHPYRGEGFAMPVLEAMASGLPVIHTGGGPTDEFCPPQAAGASARSAGRARRPRRSPRDDRRAVDARARSGAPGGAPARGRRRATTVAPAAPSAARPPCTSAGSASPASTASAPAAWPRAPRASPRATACSTAPLRSSPPRRGGPRTSCPRCCTRGPGLPRGACLYLLADPATDGTPAELEARVMAAAAGIDLDACADITILREHAVPGRDAGLHAAADLYVPLHEACAGHVRLAGEGVVAPADLGTWLAARSTPRAA